MGLQLENAVGMLENADRTVWPRPPCTTVCVTVYARVCVVPALCDGWLALSRPSMSIIVAAACSFVCLTTTRLGLLGTPRRVNRYAHISLLQACELLKILLTTHLMLGGPASSARLEGHFGALDAFEGFVAAAPTCTAVLVS
jgi:hypothetical protein